MIHILPRFGWLVHPTKCQGVAKAIQRFVALGTSICLQSQTFGITDSLIRRILDGGSALLSAPAEVSVRDLARFRGLVGATWLVSGVASRLRVRAISMVIESRARRWSRHSWDSVVCLSAEATSDIRWWLANIARIAATRSPIRPRPIDGRLDGFIFSDASDSGVGAVLFAEGPEAASSSLVGALRRRAPEGVSRRDVIRSALTGLEFIAPLPESLLEASSTLREMFGIWLFICAVSVLLVGGRHLVVLDNLGVVSILGGVVPAFARGGRRWGEYVSGGSPNPELQRMALELHDLQETMGFVLIPVWRPRTMNVRADFLSRVTVLQLHDYRLKPEVFRELDSAWGPHSIDRFSTKESCQALQPPYEGRFCALFFHPDAVWTDAFAAPWTGELNWVFPPFPFVGDAVAALRSAAAAGTLIVPERPTDFWWPLLRARGTWAPDITAVRRLGAARAVLSHFSASAHGLPGEVPLLALRFGGRHAAISVRAP